MPWTFDDVAALPKEISVFPLEGALLLPGSQLPLNIFEPRYLAMVDDALKGDRLIGMIQPCSQEQAQSGAPRLADVGCLGRLTQFLETRDGRYLITLSGVARFRWREELSVLTPYRRLAADYSEFAHDSDPSAGEERVDRDGLLRSFRAYVDREKIGVDWDSVRAAPTGVLVNALSALAPFGLLEKQALLEARDLAERAAVLTALSEIGLAQGGGPVPLQ